MTTLKFQAVSVKPRSGIAKASQKPYNMLVVKGIFTDTDGAVDTAELVFMEGQNRPLPVCVPGQTYEPIIRCYVNYDGKLTAQVDTLKPMAKAA